MTFFRFFLLICCVIAITSYKIDHRPWEDRNERAVTEWRFRRNFLYPMPEYFFNDDEHLTDADIVDAETDSEIFDKKFIEAQLYDRMNE